MTTWVNSQISMYIKKNIYNLDAQFKIQVKLSYAGL